MEHKFKLISEKVQLAVQLIDDYTGEVIKDDTSVSIRGQLKGPILNQSGYFVFTKIEGMADTLVIRSKFYFDEVITFDLNDYKENALLVCRLIPNTQYPFPSKATLIRGRVEEAGALKIKACGNEMALGRLIKPYTAGDDNIEAVKLQGITHENMLMNIKDDSEDEFCVMDDMLVSKGQFRMKAALKRDYPKGALLMYAKAIRLDEHNQFTIYFSQLNRLSCDFKICSDERELQITVQEGRTQNIGLIQW